MCIQIDTIYIEITEPLNYLYYKVVRKKNTKKRKSNKIGTNHQLFTYYIYILAGICYIIICKYMYAPYKKRCKYLYNSNNSNMHIINASGFRADIRYI